MTIAACIVGLVVGACFGVLIAALCNAAGRDSANRDYHDLEY